MTTHSLISKFIAQLCEKQYAYANSTLGTILEKKLKQKIKKTAEKMTGLKKGEKNVKNLKKPTNKKKTKMGNKKDK